MKRTRIWVILLVLFVTVTAGAQDSATQQRLNELSGKLEDLLLNQEAQRKQIDALAKEIRTLHERSNAPKPEYASQEDLNRLATKVKEVDNKRLDDNQTIKAELLRLMKAVTATPPPPKKSPSSGDSSDKPKPNEPGVEYTIQKNDTLSIIVKACKEKGMKVTADQILKANPGLKAERLIVGQKIFIPTPEKN
jgi:LysM repeat protein